VFDRLVGLVAAAVGGAALGGVHVPRPAAPAAPLARLGARGARHAGAGVVLGVVPVGAPLPDVAGHVVQAPQVGAVAPHPAGAAEERPGGRALGVLAIEVGLGRGETVAGEKDAGGAGAAGVLPLGLGRQPIGAAGLLLLRPLAESLAKGHRVVPG